MNLLVVTGYANLSIRIKLMIVFVVFSAIPFFGISWWSISGSFDNLQEKSQQRLESVREIKKVLLENYVLGVRYDAEDLAAVASAIQQSGKEATAYVPTTAYGGGLFVDFITRHGYADMYLVDLAGDVIYSAKKREDYRTNLFDGEYAQSGLGEVFQEVLKAQAYGFADFSVYGPSQGESASFVGLPVLDKQGKMVMVMALQLTIDAINAIMIHPQATGEAGELSLVGPGQLAFGGEALATSAYTPVDIFGVTYAIVAESEEVDLTGQLTDIYHELYRIGSAAAVLLLLLSFYVSGFFSRPIAALAALFGRVTSTGDFSLRAEKIVSKDELGHISYSLNRLLKTFQLAIGESNRVMGDIAQGRFESRIETDFYGDMETLKHGVNESAESVERTMYGLTQVMHAISSGNFSYRLEGLEMEGEFRNLLTNTLTVMEKAIGQINIVMEAAASGNFDQRVELDLEGDLNRLKSVINSSIGGIAKALEESVEVTEAMALGDLTQRVEGEYEGRLHQLKQALNSSVDKMEQAVSAVLEVSDSVASNAGEISSGSEQLSQRTNQQSASLEETSSSMEQMAATIQLNADHANLAGTLVASGKKEATDGVAIVKKAVNAMSQIDESSQKIASIVDLIDGISFQTNLLALNAAVEAARAGEHGRGFAVVAGEVRTLAQKAAESANEIKALIEDSSAKVREGSQLVDQTGSALNSIAESIEKVNNIVTEIASATNEQSSVINQVNSAVAQLEHVNQLNTSLVEESSAASYSLDQQTQDLVSQMDFFKVQQAGQRSSKGAASL